MEFRLENNYLEKVLDNMGRQFVDDLKSELISLGKVASGDLVNSINYRVQNNNGVLSIEIYSEDYLKYVDGGRRPGKMPPIKAIKPWVESKGIKFTKKGGGFITSESAAYVIAKSIGEKGIKATNVVSKVQKLLFAQWEAQIKLAIQEDYKEYIKKVFSDI